MEIKLDMHVHAIDANPTQESIEREAIIVRKIVDTAAARGVAGIVSTDFGHMESSKILADNLKLSDGRWVFDENYERIRVDESTISIMHPTYQNPVRVGFGEEIGTGQGEILGLFIKDSILPEMDIKDTIDDIAQQGGIIGFPHPLATFPGAGGIGKKMLVDLVDYCRKNDYPAVIEVMNGNLAWPLSWFDYRAEKLAENFGEVQIGNSDARGFFKQQYERVGSVYTKFIYYLNEISKDSIREYIKNKGLTEICGERNNIFSVGWMMKGVVLDKICGR